MDLKNFLKTIKLNENTISMVLGALVLLSITLFTINYVRNRVANVEYQNQNAGVTEEAAQTSSLPKTHKVEKGETLWGVAEKYYKSGYNFVDIKEANKLTNAGVIEVGQELTIPDVEAKKVTVELAQAQTSQAEGTVNTEKPDVAGTQVSPTTEQISPIQGDSYKVAQGDHLWGIAVRAYGDGYKWVEIAKNNNLKNPDLLLVGQEVKLQR